MTIFPLRFVFFEKGQNKGKVAVAFSFHTTPLYFYLASASEDILSLPIPQQPLNRPVTYPCLLEDDQGEVSIYYKEHPIVNAEDKGLHQRIRFQDKTSLWSDRETLI
jgi:hypothetical protein